MPPTPIYIHENLTPAYHLRYAWTGWPTSGTEFPVRPESSFFEPLDDAWHTDHLRRIATHWQRDKIQFTFSSIPTVSPIHFVARVKGRLQHALRLAGTPARFSRKVAFRGIGDNHSADIKRYVARQVDRERFADERFANLLKQFTKVNDVRRFAEPLASNSGRYWYNLHIVLVISGRGKIGSLDELQKLDGSLEGTAAKHRYDIVVRSWLLDHLHLGLRGNIEESPQRLPWRC